MRGPRNEVVILFHRIAVRKNETEFRVAPIMAVVSSCMKKTLKRQIIFLECTALTGNRL